MGSAADAEDMVQEAFPGEKSAASAAAAEGKNVALAALAGRAGHTGQQQIPLVLTPVKNRPS
jgi:hypothetical protein